jgi:hypothetical protein
MRCCMINSTTCFEIPDLVNLYTNREVQKLSCLKMQLLQLEGPPSPRSQPPTEQDWAVHKPVITSLYILEDLTLDHVKKIMKMRYGFKAT